MIEILINMLAKIFNEYKVVVDLTTNLENRVVREVFR